MKVEAQIKINATKPEVWKAITNIQNADKIISGVEKIEILKEPANGLVGLKWQETRMYFGKPSAIDKWITDAVENNFYKTRAEMDGFVFITTMTISESGNDIFLTSSHETQSQSLITKIKSLPMIFFKGILRKAILKDLTDIKSEVEHK
jgi:hypothetical protein